jgi:ribosomal protein L30/L7E
VLFCTLKRSWLKRGPRVQRTLIGLGFKKRFQTVAKPDTPTVRGQIWRCRHLLEVKAEDATSILRTGKAEHHPMPMEKIPLTQEVLNRQRQILIHGLRQFNYLQTKRARLEFQLNEAKRLARKALEPKGYPLHAPPKPLPVLKKRKGLKNNKLMQRLSVDRVVAPKLTKPPKPL